MAQYFTNYYTAKKLAEKRGLKECEYGDYNDKVSYCLWNKSGDREDDAAIEAYYTWQREADGHLRPEHRASSWLKSWVYHNIGVKVK